MRNEGLCTERYFASFLFDQGVDAHQPGLQPKFSGLYTRTEQSHLAVFTININAIGCYHFVSIFRMWNFFNGAVGQKKQHVLKTALNLLVCLNMAFLYIFKWSFTNYVCPFFYPQLTFQNKIYWEQYKIQTTYLPCLVRQRSLRTPPKMLLLNVLFIILCMYQQKSESTIYE